MRISASQLATLGLLSAGLTACIRFRADDIRFNPSRPPDDLTGEDRGDWEQVERTVNELYLLRSGMLNRYGDFDAKTRNCLRPKMNEIEDLFKELMDDRWRFQNASIKGNEPVREDCLNQIQVGLEEIRNMVEEAGRCVASRGTPPTTMGMGDMVGGIAGGLLLIGLTTLAIRAAGGRGRASSSIVSTLTSTKPTRLLGGWRFDGSGMLCLDRFFIADRIASRSMGIYTWGSLAREVAIEQKSLKFVLAHSHPTAPDVTSKPVFDLTRDGLRRAHEYLQQCSKTVRSHRYFQATYEEGGALKRPRLVEKADDPLTPGFLLAEYGTLTRHLEWIATNMFEGFRLT
ncbi:MAG: hypothetical protein HYT76_01935 [Deltaproteobacteria bacterium]|nr:hypothetical protein [Deltaproteobacteria bacterium]